MIRNFLIAALLLGTIFIWTRELQARFTPISIQSTNGPILVELFTSQGCSSCPPADQIMNQLAENPNFIPISYHVTYWDYIGWKDSLGRVFSDGRQRGYSDFKNAKRVYTPQMIINGKKEFVGSRKHEANRNLSKAKPVAAIRVTGKTPDKAMITLPQTKNGNYAIWVAGIDAAHIEKIARGENRGKNITYTNTVIALDQGERWDGTAKTMSINLKRDPNIDHYVVFAQNKGFGEIVAATKIMP